MPKVQMKTAVGILIVAAMLATTVVIPQRADAQSTGQTKVPKAKADCEKAKMRWDDTAKKCSK